MHGLAAVAGAQQGRVFWRKAEVLRPTRFHKGQGLQRLERGSGKGHPVRIARVGQELALPVDHGDRAKVLVLQGAATGHFYKWCVLHAAIVEQIGDATSGLPRPSLA